MIPSNNRESESDEFKFPDEEDVRALNTLSFETVSEWISAYSEAMITWVEGLSPPKGEYWKMRENQRPTTISILLKLSRHESVDVERFLQRALQNLTFPQLVELYERVSQKDSGCFHCYPTIIPLIIPRMVETFPVEMRNHRNILFWRWRATKAVQGLIPLLLEHKASDELWGSVLGAIEGKRYPALHDEVQKFIRKAPESSLHLGLLSFQKKFFEGASQVTRLEGSWNMPNAETRNDSAMLEFLRGPQESRIVSFLNDRISGDYRIEGKGFSVSYQAEGSEDSGPILVTKNELIFKQEQEIIDRAKREVAYLESLSQLPQFQGSHQPYRDSNQLSKPLKRSRDSFERQI